MICPIYWLVLWSWCIWYTVSITTSTTTTPSTQHPSIRHGFGIKTRKWSTYYIIISYPTDSRSFNASICSKNPEILPTGLKVPPVLMYSFAKSMDLFGAASTLRFLELSEGTWCEAMKSSTSLRSETISPQQLWYTAFCREYYSNLVQALGKPVWKRRHSVYFLAIHKSSARIALTWTMVVLQVWIPLRICDILHSKGDCRDIK